VGIPVPYAMLDPRTRILWASLDHGHWGQKLARSKNLGRTWEEVSAPTYPAKALVKPEQPGKRGQPAKPGKPATLKYIWTIAPGGEDEKKRLYLGTQPGGLFASDDGGKSFELVKGLWNHPSRLEQWFGGGRDEPAIHSVLVDPRASDRVLVGISCAGVFETQNGGRSWEPRNRGLRADFLPDPGAEVGQDPHLLAWCASAPDALWQQNHCGIFRSTDGARSWTQVSNKKGPAHFGFPVSVDADDPATAWVVPGQADDRRMAFGAALCVCRTEDGGRTWKALRRGLPQEDCYDVVYRHALDLSRNALAMGSTTGNVFFSPDRGDSWQSLGHHFPPVYSVRFAG
jgi:photosystem II stability/assembly factor-like uncharacterized protein